jgi:hypothetical protein
MFLLAALIFAWQAWVVYNGAVVTVEWSTASEFNSAGFNLLRSDAADVEYRQINSELIPASTDPMTGGKYEYLDEDVIPGNTYYYQLEEVETDGGVIEYGPIVIQARHGGNIEAILGGGFLFMGLVLVVLAFRRTIIRS